MPKQQQKIPYSDVKLSYLTKFLQGPAILDVGAGQCHYSSWIAQQYPTYDVTAIDLLDIEKPTTFRYIKQNLEQPLSLQNNSISTIIGFDIVEHILNEQAFLRELHRVCAKGGFFIGSVPHDDDGFLPEYNLTFYHRTDITHKRYYTVESLRESLNKSGFIPIVISPEGGVSPQVFAEFFPQRLRYSVKKVIGLFRRLHIISTNRLSSDLFFVAQKPKD